MVLLAVTIIPPSGYMAPEMIIMPNQHHTVRKGYTEAVDYWSLGVTLYKLLTKSRPYSRRNYDAFLQVSRCRIFFFSKILPNRNNGHKVESSDTVIA